MTSPRSTDDTLPRVSVLMPVYNSEKYLADAIESVLSQSFEDFELLVHDDGSTDGSAQILQKYARRDKRICVSQAPNAGITAVLNLLATAARGEYLGRMDSDDICMPERFALQVAALDGSENLVALGTNWITMDSDGRLIAVAQPPLHHDEIDYGNMRGHVGLNHPTVMIRRKALEAAGGYHNDFPGAEDIDLWLRLAEVGTLGNLPDVLLHYRIHANSISSAKHEEQLSSLKRACETAGRRRGISVPFESSGWRMKDTKTSKREFYLKYAWQAWNCGFRDTWRHYALQSIRLAPFSAAAWKVLILGALRRPEGKTAHG